MCNKYPYFLAALSKDKENVENSSSGGIFYELCRIVFKQDGIVYGAAAVSPYKVKHQRADALEKAKAFRRSKYLKSEIKKCLPQIKYDLEDGKTVLFSGVGCQIAALYKYLGRIYKGLITCEVVCHGAPLTKALEKYVEETEENRQCKICGINFRDKSKGWKENCWTEYYADGQLNRMPSREHPVHSLYLQGINMEMRCASCKYAVLPRIADITLADFWKYQGIIPHNNKGISLIAVNSAVGETILEQIRGYIYWEPVSKESALLSCRHMANPPILHKNNKAFRKLLQIKGFAIAFSLCRQWEVAAIEDLYTIKNLSAEHVFNVFQKDTQEIIYYIDEEKKARGIITYGSFLNQYVQRENWVNEKFFRIILSDHSTDDAEKIFRENPKINRVPVIDEKEHLICEIRRHPAMNGRSDERKGWIPFAKLAHGHITCFYIKRPDLWRNVNIYSPSQAKRIKEKISFSVMQENWEGYKEDFTDLFGAGVTEEYIKGLCKIPPIYAYKGHYRHLDLQSQYVNVFNGCRITVGQPTDFDFTIHMYGRCGVFGYAVEDKDTVPSRLQELLNKNRYKVKVVNHGLWGADALKIFHNLSSDIDEGIIGKEDIVVIYMDYISDMEELKRFNVLMEDTTNVFHMFLENNGNFYDKPGHMTAEGYGFIAEFMYKRMNKEFLCHGREKRVKTNRVYGSDYKNFDIESYVEKVKKILPMEGLANSEIGAIVMNCNPFTKGHRFLIETSLKKVDALIIFVLEENQSYYSFEDRYHMVKMGTADMQKVYVVPSGKFIISAITFPEYFLKDQQIHVKINAADDIEIFGRYIAPKLNISTRFVGTEPVDSVTSQYNEQLKKILPEFGIKLVEVPRLKQGGNYVTATKVRELIVNNNVESVKYMVPYSTYKYLKEIEEKRR